MPADKNFSMTDADIEEIFTIKKGPYTFMVLSLLYPQLKFHQNSFHQDHIHPQSRFTKKEFNELNIDEANLTKWIALKDTLPNLQLLEGDENKTKQAKRFKDWYDEANITNYNAVHYIPSNVDLHFNHFDVFYKERKRLLMEEIKTLFA